MNIDFSQVNLMYLIQARDLAAKDRDLVVTLLDIPDELAKQLSEIPPQRLAPVAIIKPPLVTMRQDVWWWSRLLAAIREGRTEEIEAIVDHLPLITVK